MVTAADGAEKYYCLSNNEARHEPVKEVYFYILKKKKLGYFFRSKKPKCLELTLKT
jgi:hypothetical protein